MLRQVLNVAAVAAILGLMLVIYVLFAATGTPTRDDVYPVSGTVSKVFSPCCLDIVVSLEDDDRVFYINRGLERGDIHFPELQRRLNGRSANLLVQKRLWTPFDPGHNLRPIAEIEVDDVVVFSAFGDPGRG